MGSGIEKARAINPELAAAIENMRDQLLLVLIGRLGGKVEVPVREIDGTGGIAMTMDLDTKRRVFTFELVDKP